MRSIRVQLDYLRRFADQIRTGVQRLDGTLRRRAELYVLSARPVYESVRLKVDTELGKSEERNILSDSEHCDGCQAEADREWVGIGELVPIGERDCLSRCNCRIERR
jgi:uncharacterized heparinase superfamily protein